jgi:hypothetical protein
MIFPQVKDKVSRRYKKSGKIILIFMLLGEILREEFVKWMLRHLPPLISSALNVFVNAISMCYCRSQIFRLLHILKRFVSSLFPIMILMTWRWGFNTQD